MPKLSIYYYVGMLECQCESIETFGANNNFVFKVNRSFQMCSPSQISEQDPDLLTLLNYYGKY